MKTFLSPLNATEEKEYLRRQKEGDEEAKKVYAIVATGEKALYANIMLQKGVVI